MYRVEYRSQEQQDTEESGKRCGASCGPAHAPITPRTPEEELQFKLWEHEIWCDIWLEHDEENRRFVVKAIGRIEMKAAARPIIQEWLDAFVAKYMEQLCTTEETTL